MALKHYNIITGIRGTIVDDRITNVAFEYQTALLDLAQVNAVYPDTYSTVISNVDEYWKARNAKWHLENPEPKPGQHPPNMMGTLIPSSLSCVTIQIGNQLFHFNMQPDAMFDLVLAERSK